MIRINSEPEQQVYYWTTITCRCPECDKLFDVKRLVEQFKPIKNYDKLCPDCRVNHKK
jgi:hypothetical protein